MTSQSEQQATSETNLGLSPTGNAYFIELCELFFNGDGQMRGVDALDYLRGKHGVEAEQEVRAALKGV